MAQIIYEKCFEEEVCVDVIFDRFCASAKGCVRIIKDGPDYKVQIELFGQRITHDLAKTCYPAYSIGIATLEVCVDPDIRDGNLKGIKITARLCIGTRVDKVNLSKCWDVIRSGIDFIRVDDLVADGDEPNRLDSREMIATARRVGVEYVYVERDLLNDPRLVVEDFFDHNSMKGE